MKRALLFLVDFTVIGIAFMLAYEFFLGDNFTLGLVAKFSLPALLLCLVIDRLVRGPLGGNNNDNL